MKRLNAKGQGTTEYIVILAIVVGIAIAVIMGPLKTAITSKLSEITSAIGSTQV